MKQYLDKQQTAKLIELGFEKPCSIASVEPIYGMGGISVAKAYTIGELMEMLPASITSIRGRDNFLLIEYLYIEWQVKYGGRLDLLLTTDAELIDALYRMFIMLKEYKLL